MIPAWTGFVDHLPTTPNGKLDRRALPSPMDTSGGHRSPSDGDDAWTPPSTPTQTRLAELWSELLDVPRVGLQDDFFSLGGHSLLTMRLAHRVREAWNADLTVRDVFEARTLEAIAARIDQGVEAAPDAASSPPGASPTGPTLEPWPRDRPAPASRAQERMRVIHAMDPTDSSYNQPVILRLRGALDHPALSDALNSLEERHEALRTTLDAGPDHLVQHVQPPSPHPLQLDHLSSADLVDDWVAGEVERPFDLLRDPCGVAGWRASPRTTTSSF